MNFSKIMERLQQVRYIPATLKLVWQAARWYTVAWLVLILFQGLIPLATVYLSRPLVNQLVVLIGEGTAEQMRSAILLICLMGGILLLDELVRSVASWVKIAQSELTQDHISHLIQTQSTQLDLAYFESAEYYDRLYRALMEARGRPIALLESLGSLLQNGLTLIGVSAILAMFGLWFPLLLIGSALPAFWIVLRFMVRFNQWRLKNTLDTRRTLYYQVVLTQRETAPELRLLDLTEHFQQAYHRVRQRLRRERIGLAKEEAGAHLFAGLFGLLAVGIAMFWILRQALQGLVSLGDIALVYQGLQQGQRILRSLLSNSGELYRNLNFLEDLFGFLALTPKVVDPEDPQPLPDLATADICLDQVTFGYPHSDRRILDNFSLTLPAGKMVAIVGTNGAGKSTLIKLLCRFYDPEGGRITIGGIDLRHVQIAELHRSISVLFQQFVSYHASAHENIAFGNWQGAPNCDDVQRAARESGADTVIQRLPEKYNTELGRWFGGAELSTGEWQRISLARAFLRQSPILILDEPTSAMDAWAETQWLHNFRRLARGRTTLLITHRFTTAMYADMIHVMDEGVVVESGAHDELLALGGRYAQSWHDQMRPGAPIDERAGVVEMV